ncbi:MAG: PAS domain-containing protein [Alphaproteobacteria bacterium]|jgi:hypothetical protein|nr:PAS domain-containing protein [Alphaproteobacteria bacterium]MDP6812524.1 PAS domain-containing protein [Alphaproteobacteria bacterium]
MRFDQIEPLTANCRDFAAVWQGWRGHGLMPSRSDVRLENLKPVLPWITLAEVPSNSEIIFRLAGTMIRELLGVELTGRNLLDLTEPALRERRGHRSYRTAAQPCGAIWIWRVGYRGGGVEQVEQLALPLRPNEADKPPQLMTVTGPLGEGMRPVPLSRLQILESAEYHHFIDIGAGEPDIDPSYQ